MFKSKKLQTVVATFLAFVMTLSVVICAVPSPSVSTSGTAASANSSKATAQIQLASQEQMDEAKDMLTGEQSAKPTASVKKIVDGKCNCGNCPVIVVPGINHSPTYVYDENDNPVTDSKGNPIGAELMILNGEKIKNDAIKQMVGPLAKMLITQKDNGFTDKVYDFACETFEYQKVDNDGNFVQNLKTKRFYSVDRMTEDEKGWMYRMVPMKPLVDEIGEDHTYFFTFNLVGNVLESVDALHEYIQTVKKETGHDKVNLINVSLGGSVFTGYIDVYGLDDINEVVNVVGALDGTDLVADIIGRNFILDDEFIYHEFIPKAVGDDKALGYFLNAVVRIMPKEVFQGTLTAAVSGVLDTMILNCPQFWAMVPSDRYDELAARYLNDGKHDVLKAKTDRYHQAQLNLKDNVIEGAKKGVQINSISGANLAYGDVDYNFFSIMASSKTVNSDGVIRLKSTTMGAYGAQPGHKLPADYVQAKTYDKDPTYSYISPDGCIDASTSALPDNTWIFCYQHHEAGRNTVVLNLAKALLTNDELVDVHSMPNVWPQFNGTCNNNALRRWKINAAKAVDQSTLSPEDAAELNAAIAQAEAQIAGNIADEKYAQATLARMDNILIKIGVEEAPEEPSKWEAVKETFAELLSKALLKYYGNNGFSDGPKKGIFAKDAA